jgi:UDP-N-acetylmuramoyl-L-alanyl-D-glutamate--2,6-diaminopimelate ligase
MTPVNMGQPFEVVVDFAHTPSSFEAALAPLRERLNSVKSHGTKGRLICIFGSAGERDTQKRPQQGEIAARFSDIIFLADEDPRGEDPMTILEEIAQGFETLSGFEYMRRNETLFLIPREGDLVILLGKGHENSIIYAQKTVAYDEISEAEKALEEMGYTAKL